MKTRSQSIIRNEHAAEATLLLNQLEACERRQHDGREWTRNCNRMTFGSAALMLGGAALFMNEVCSAVNPCVTSANSECNQRKLKMHLGIVMFYSGATLFLPPYLLTCFNAIRNCRQAR